ncbi:hypothetical protein AB3Z07_27635 (plasmid) [Metabacillus halosaccharovorans]|uniref:hypothetical protein n=1 Tax=Metabacillus halosaccharovorans TaxID=930124 RepID=UPI00203F3F66|nr:hypothetical protein [Metabacillus halosaccharovorans]MCM3441333.1 hypothetical protein [Metabacillus halosaccharovorans]
MSKQSKSTFSDFVNRDRFELNSYVAYLIHQAVAEHSKDEKRPCSYVMVNKVAYFCHNTSVNLLSQRQANVIVNYKI